MLRLLVIQALALTAWLALPVAAAPLTTQQLVGKWYNADYGIYPSFAMLTLTADGKASIGALNGRTRSGHYELTADGRLVIRVQEDTAPFAFKTIIDSVPRLDADRLQIKAKNRVFLFSRAAWLKAEIDKASDKAEQRLEEAQARQEKQQELPKQAPAPVAVPVPKPRTQPVEEAEEVAEVEIVEVAKPRIRRLLVQVGGEGAGRDGCTDPVVEALAAEGWELVDDKKTADALVIIKLSGIHYEHSIWVGRYYKINYRVELRSVTDDHLLGYSEGAERASGDGWFEVCTDVADDIAGEVEDLIEDAEDD